MSPKSLLRRPEAVSTPAEFTSGRFEPVLGAAQAGARRVVLCSGKLFYDLKAAAQDRADVALVRLEALYPFPATALAEELARHAADATVVWAQEEPENQGAWRYLRARVDDLMEGTGRRARYVGRPESASTATGSAKVHARTQAELVARALG
jgi:2-oxoglutarate dehydrogenase complex dehydrogenase (E1) component-like enzyme